MLYLFDGMLCDKQVLYEHVMYRKRSLGTQSEKGDRWVERILSLRQTCRIRKISAFRILVDAMCSFFAGQQPDLALLTPAG